MNAGVRQVRAGFYGVVSYEDRHVSEPYPDEYWEVAQIIADAPSAARGALVQGLEGEFNAHLVAHLVHLTLVSNGLQRPTSRREQRIASLSKYGRHS